MSVHICSNNNNLENCRDVTGHVVAHVVTSSLDVMASRDRSSRLLSIRYLDAFPSPSLWVELLISGILRPDSFWFPARTLQPFPDLLPNILPQN